MTLQRVITGLFLIAGLINFVPLAGVMGNTLLESAYGIEVASADLSLLLRHRAVLFGIVGGLLLVSAFKPALRVTAGVCGMISMTSFILLYFLAGPINPELAGVMRADLAGIAALALGIALSAKERAAPNDAAPL